MTKKEVPDVTAGRTEDAPRAARRAPRPSPFLFAVLRVKDASFEPSRHSLDGVTTITIGRGPKRAAARSSDRDATLAIAHDDPWMSGKHATLTRDGKSWVLRDLGSRNHTFVNGEETSETALEDGDVIEVGNVFFVFRDSIVATDEDAGDVGLSQIEHAAPALATLLPPLARAFRRLAGVATSSLAVFLGGESGTGKEVAARAVHALSGRKGAFVPVNCAAIAPTLVESELFGYRKGAFSGANEDRPGLVRSADGGTLFLDEIGDLPLAAQGALLRVLQEHEVVPVGATKPVPVDLRVVAATHRDLDELVRAKTFRADLQARLLGLTLKLPALRDRMEDLGLLCRALVARRPEAAGRDVVLDLDAARAMFLHDWPLNIRELERRLSAAIVLAGDAPILAEHVFLEDDPTGRDSSSAKKRAPEKASRVEELSEEDRTRREELHAKLEAHAWNVSAVAREMGKARMQVQRWIKRYGLARGS